MQKNWKVSAIKSSLFVKSNSFKCAVARKLRHMKLNDFTRVTQLISGAARIWTREPELYAISPLCKKTRNGKSIHFKCQCKTLLKWKVRSNFTPCCQRDSKIK